MTASQPPTEPSTDAIEGLPLVGPWLADSIHAWLGLADALNLGALRHVLLADPDDLPSPGITRADTTPSSSTFGQWVDLSQAAGSSPPSDRAA